MEIQDSVAIITGAGSGIGEALAQSFAAAGARVVVGDIDAAAADGTARRISERGQHAVAVCADAGVDTDIRTMIDVAATRFGPVDIYVANAGVSGPPGLGMSEHDWDLVLDVNVRAHVRAAKLVLPGLDPAWPRPLRQHRIGSGSTHTDWCSGVRGEQACGRRLRRMAGDHLRRRRDRRELCVPPRRQHRVASFGIRIPRRHPTPGCQCDQPCCRSDRT